MGKSIAVAGKGGTGKTTISGLLIRVLADNGKVPILALDADPNSNLNEVLGVEVKSTVGMLREEFKKNAPRMAKGIYKDQLVEMNIQEALVENKKYDLLVMGRGEGPGCYCYANSLFRKYIEMLQGNYNFIVMDNEAGMEHLSRRTTQDIDYLLIVSDPSPRGIMTAARIRDLAMDLELKVKDIFLIVNRVKDELDKRLEGQIEDNNLKLISVLNYDDDIFEMDISSGSVFSLPASSSALGKSEDILKQLDII